MTSRQEMFSNISNIITKRGKIDHKQDDSAMYCCVSFNFDVL